MLASVVVSLTQLINKFPIESKSLCSVEFDLRLS
jgi:hypothetical protein